MLNVFCQHSKGSANDLAGEETLPLQETCLQAARVSDQYEETVLRNEYEERLEGEGKLVIL